MKKIITFIFSLFILTAFAQENKTLVSYKGGNEQLAKDIDGNFASVFKSYNFNGKVNLTFIVDENGKVQNPSLDAESDDNQFKTEIFRALKRTDKNWVAATVNGKAVSSQVTIPLNSNTSFTEGDARNRFISGDPFQQTRSR